MMSIRQFIKAINPQAIMNYASARCKNRQSEILLKQRTNITFYSNRQSKNSKSVIVSDTTMFPLLFRVGPVLMAQVIFMITGVAQVLVKELFPCYGYTFIELALQLFLIEMIVVFRLINKNKQLRQKYIGKLVFGTTQYYRKRMWWNGTCIGFVIVSMAYWMVREGLNISNSEMRDEEKIFTLYPLCFFSDEATHPESSEQLDFILKFLYACNVLMNMLLITLNIRALYTYIEKIKRNRKFFQKNTIQKSESLIDCEIINKSINQSLISTENSEDIDCGICLRKFCGQKVIRLRCSHHFHDDCIIDWLQRKDQCPYRCI